MESKTIVGWREWVYLPALGIGPIKAKIDTGARTSALHAHDLAIDGDTVRFKIYTIQGRTDFELAVEAPLVDHRMVRDSGGKETRRPIIATDLVIAGEARPIEISLIDREGMTFRMLIGREALTPDLVVDCGQSYVGGVPAETRGWEAA